MIDQGARQEPQNSRLLVVKVDHCFDQAGLEVQAGQFLHGLAEVETVRHQRQDVDQTVLHRLDHAAERSREARPAGKNGEFTAVEIRIVKAEFTDEQPEENYPAAVFGQMKCPPHRSLIAGRIDHERRHLAEMVRQFLS